MFLSEGLLAAVPVGCACLKVLVAEGWSFALININDNIFFEFLCCCSLKSNSNSRESFSSSFTRRGE